MTRGEKDGRATSSGLSMGIIDYGASQPFSTRGGPTSHFSFFLSLYAPVFRLHLQFCRLPHTASRETLYPQALEMTGTHYSAQSFHDPWG